MKKTGKKQSPSPVFFCTVCLPPYSKFVRWYGIMDSCLTGTLFLMTRIFISGIQPHSSAIHS